MKAKTVTMSANPKDYDSGKRPTRADAQDFSEGQREGLYRAIYERRDVRSQCHAQPHQIAYPPRQTCANMYWHAYGVTGGQAMARRLRLDSGLGW